MRDGYRLVRLQAECETGLSLDTFPPNCPFSFEQAMRQDFWPE
jgi:hypothetical protein